MSEHASAIGFHGPKCWLVSGAAGAVIGFLLAQGVPIAPTADGAPDIPIWLVAPFVLLLASIAFMPFISARIWHRHYPDFAILLGAVVVGYYLSGFGTIPGGAGTAYAQHKVLHAAIEYYSFIALIGGLFVVSGGILVDVRGRGGPLANTILLACGAVLANIVGTTGASMLLIRPFMRVNKDRLRPVHIVFFILIVSNCGGCLTPIGDPPLYLGFLKGVPFLWTLEHLWLDWAFVVGILLALFFAVDTRLGRTAAARSVPRAHEPEAAQLIREEIRDRPGLRIRGWIGLVCLALMIFGVFVDPLLERLTGLHGIPIGATFQIAVAIAAYVLAPRTILAENDFNFGPVREVGLLFAGIFATMIPALGYLGAHAAELGLGTSTTYYFATGTLSAVLDNAPTYVSFLQVAFGSGEITAGSMLEFLRTDTGPTMLSAISTGAVFFGAMTYIGNGPNFMVKAIAESAGVRMPTFFGYVAFAAVLLLPALVLHWAVFIR